MAANVMHNTEELLYITKTNWKLTPVQAGSQALDQQLAGHAGRHDYYMHKGNMSFLLRSQFHWTIIHTHAISM